MKKGSQFNSACTDSSRIGNVLDRKLKMGMQLEWQM
jgi:hypothetical protein